MTTLTPAQASDIRAKLDKFDAWLNTKRNKRNGWASYRPEDIPADVPRVSNDERSALEVFDFVNNPPAKYFLYIKQETNLLETWQHGRATTWTGETLGAVSFGREWRSNMGDRRVPVTIRAINGRTYVGTYYKSTGDYARVRLAKGGN
jgi:hypothetical protein